MSQFEVPPHTQDSGPGPGAGLRLYSNADVAQELGAFVPGIFGPRPSLWLKREKEWELPREPLRVKPYQICVNPQPLTLRRNPDFSLFMGTQHLDIPARYLPLVEKHNLSHHRAAPVFNRLLFYTERLWGLSGMDPEFRAVGNSGSAAIENAIKIANWYHENIGSGRRGVVCSEGAHSSGMKTDRTFTWTLPLDPSTRQMDPQALLSTLQLHKPAALILTVVRTDDGVVEQCPPEVVAYCKSEGVLIIQDFNLAALMPLLPDAPVRPGDSAHTDKEEYLAALAVPADIVVGGLGKIIGMPGAATMFFHKDTNEKLRAAADEVLISSYFTSTRFFGSTTNLAGPAYYSIKTIEELGPLLLFFLGQHSRRTAEDFSAAISGRGREVWKVRNNCAVVSLRDTDEADAVRLDLRTAHDLDVAVTGGCGPGIRLVFNLDRIMTPFSLNALADAVDDSIRVVRGEKRKALRHFDSRLTDWPRHFLVERDHLQVLKRFYNREAGEQDSAAPAASASLESKYERALNLINQVDFQHRLRAGRLAGALTILHQHRRWHPSWELYSDLSRAIEFVDAFRAANKHPRGGPHGQWWQKLLMEQAEHIEHAARMLKRPFPRDKRPVLEKLFQSVAGCDEAFSRSWYESLAPTPRSVA